MQIIRAARRLVIAETISEYIRRLENLGIKKIGEGGYGVVFQHPTLDDVVVKLLAESDPDYLRWVKFSRKHQSNPYVPNILNVSSAEDTFDLGNSGRFSGSLANMHLIFMEKLKPMTRPQFEKFGAYVVGLANRILGSEDYQYHDIVDNVKLWTDVSKQTKDMNMAVVAKFISSRGKAGTELDLHLDNIMTRGSQAVITDPFAS